MKENELKQKLYESLDETLGKDLKVPLQIEEVSSVKDSKTYVAFFQPRTTSHPIAAEFPFQSYSLGGYLPAIYRVATWSDYKIPSTILATSYPRGDIMRHSVTAVGLGKTISTLIRKYIFIPTYPNKEFNSDTIFDEKVGWYPLVETLNQDEDLKSWLKEMPTETQSKNRKAEIDFGNARNLSSCFGQILPIPPKGGVSPMTSISFYALPRLKIDVFGNMKGLNLSYLKNLVMEIERIDKHIQNFGYNKIYTDKIPELPLIASERFIYLSLLARQFAKEQESFVANSTKVRQIKLPVS